MVYHSNCGSCGNYSCGSNNYSSLENAVREYSPAVSSISQEYSVSDLDSQVNYSVEAIPRDDFRFYKGNSGSRAGYSDRGYSSTPVSRTYSHVMDDFLRSDRPHTPFIGSSNDIKEFVEEAFYETTGRNIPDDILIRVLDEEGMKKAHSKTPGPWSEGIHGFAINRRKFGMLSEVFVKKGELSRIMLTLGHELGHVLTNQLEDVRDEEAKAFSFSIAWMRKIKEKNIANLATSIRLGRPAENGVHNVALDFVLNQLDDAEPMEIFADLSNKVINVNSQ